MKELLGLEDLSVSFFTGEGECEAIRDLDLKLYPGEILAVVGESGCGKTVLGKAICGLLPPAAKIKKGRIIYNELEISSFSEKQRAKIRGKEISMIFQDPLASLNPMIPVGKQIIEGMLIHEKISKQEAYRRAMELFHVLEIDQAEERLLLPPHFFSGGMRQRLVMAVALACKPKILVADEPTTALDSAVQTKILDLLKSVCSNMGVSILFISHDLAAVARICDRILVLYAGKVVEIGTIEEIFYDARHPYTWGLLEALPYFKKTGENFSAIPGMPPSMTNLPKGDAFAPRNRYALSIDFEKMPPLFQISPSHFVASWLMDKKAPKIERPSFLNAPLERRGLS